ncbi:MAG: hypothetical protein ABI747_04340 [Candidatus Moraniibacteriota bacterium]
MRRELVKEKWRNWCERYGRDTLFALGLLLVGTLSFEAGMLKKSVGETEPMIIRIPEIIPEARPVEKVKVNETAPLETTKESTVSANSGRTAPKECLYVGSKNSNKYHVPESRCAKQIKGANLVCFKDKAAAESRGYVAGCLQ